MNLPRSAKLIEGYCDLMAELRQSEECFLIDFIAHDKQSNDSTAVAGYPG